LSGSPVFSIIKTTILFPDPVEQLSSGKIMDKPLTIATWNVERYPQKRWRLAYLNDKLRKLMPDITVLTETNVCITPNTDYKNYHSGQLEKELGGSYYQEGERRVGIWSKYEITGYPEVTDRLTTACALLDTPLGELAVFGCITGVWGRGEQFDTDFRNQIADLKRLTEKYSVCYAGDLNLTFSDNTYTNIKKRDELNAEFSSLKMMNLTADIPGNIDHIVVSESFFSGVSGPVRCWNKGKQLSDHMGVMVSLIAKQ